MKVAALPGASVGAKVLVTPVLNVDAVSSSFSMGTKEELLASPDGLRPVRTLWRQPEDCAKVKLVSSWAIHIYFL